MRDDDLLRRLAELARQEEDEAEGPLDPRWDALAAGRLSPAEAEALRVEAGESAATAAAYEAFAPLDAGFRSRVVEAVQGRLAGETREPAVATPAAAVASLEARRSSPPAIGTRRSGNAESRRRRWLGRASVAAALAAAVVLVVLRPWSALAPLPVYSAHLTGWTRQWRAGEEGAAPSAPAPAAPLFEPGNRLELVLTPQESVAEAPAVRTFLLHGGDLAPWTVPYEVSDQGAVRLGGTVGEEVRLPAGASSVVVAIGRPGSLPEVAAVRGRLGELLAGGSAACRPLARDALLCAVPVAFRPGP